MPSDLEQMPHLLNFIEDKGTLLTNDHTILTSHTAGGILTYLTGMYPDRHGLSVTNSYRYFKADGTTASSSAFKYWTDLVDDTGIPPADPLPNMETGTVASPRTRPRPGSYTPARAATTAPSRWPTWSWRTPAPARTAI